MSTTIKDRISLICSERGINISDVETACDLTPKSIYRWVKSTPSVDKVVKVAQYLRVDVNYLLGLTPYQTKWQEWDERYNQNGQLTNKVKQLESGDIIAAHLEDKDITDAKLDALTQYIDLLFEKKR